MRSKITLLLSTFSLLACTGILGGDTASDTAAKSGCSGDEWFRDQDGDGFGKRGGSEKGCEAPSGYVDNADDCDDEDPHAYPGATEVCDDVDADEDCDGASDEEDDDVALNTYYADSDGDGFGDPETTKSACEQPSGYVTEGGDCDDDSSRAYPGANEVCDKTHTDEDCDGLVNDDDDSMSSSGLTKNYRDDDGDGYGDGTAVTACELDGYATKDGDCDDSESKANPGETEVCNDGIDNDCDGTPNGCDSSGTRTASTADVIIHGAASDNLGYLSRPAGDQNGDGVDDLLLAAVGAGTHGEGYLFFGPLSGSLATTSADVTISGASNGETLG